MRVGIGYDVHKLADGRKLVLGGVLIPCGKGLLGHSDADVLAHAVMDALLGAAALGDIGTHFPDTDVKYKNADSMALLKTVAALLKRHSWRVENIDGIIIAEKPKLSPFYGEMRHNIATALEIDISQVGVKATTEEGLGFTGCGQGIAAKAVCAIERIM